MNEIGLRDLKRAFERAGAVRLVAKRLAENDNSKNQIYIGGSFDVLNILPFEKFKVVTSAKGRAVIHARLVLSWLRDDGSAAPAPHAKLILYPQYPEVRLSGFLRGALDAPSNLMDERARIAGRVLFLGIRADRTVVARVFPPAAAVVRELAAARTFDGDLTLAEVPLGRTPTRDTVLTTLRDIAARGWLRSQRLDNDRVLHPCDAPNCGGLTLESLLGIPSNSRAEPDFLGWEIKQFAVRNFTGFAAKSAVTLFTPEPGAGVYVENGIEAFIRRWGYPDTKGREDRLNFGGRFVVDRRNARTRLTMRLIGFDTEKHRIADAAGGISLIDDKGVVAASWPFASLIEHWNEKHAKAVFVPSLSRNNPREYRYSDTLFLGEGTDFGRFLKAVSEGTVAYDPGIKLEDASGPAPKAKKRSQFRIAARRLSVLYRTFEKSTPP